jgi:Rrf2 family transcriptional regulator, iron-sulfur cluster assembly transcription factor
MLVTRKTDYAVRCVLYLAGDEERVSNVTEVSKAVHVPKSFLAKIFQKLTKAGLVESIRGMNGGFRLAKKPSDISLLDVMSAIQGPADINLCAVDSRKCRKSAMCSVHPVWTELRQIVNDRLRAQTIDRLAGLKK